MDFSDKKLYHQVHPAKLATDISFSIITLYLFWRHQLVWGLVLHFLPPIIATFLVIKYANLAAIKRSALGHYLHRYMMPPVEMTRLAGDVVTVFGAWYHQPLVIVAGLAVILAAWFNGKLRALLT